MTRMLTILVKPRARAATLRELEDGTWCATLRAPPVDGKANAELVALVAAHFGCAKARVAIRSGAGARHKRVAIELPD